jgi:hypothetical protein
MADKDIRLVDDDEAGLRHGYQPKDPKKVGDGYKPKDNPVPSNPPKGKKTEGDKK